MASNKSKRGMNSDYDAYPPGPPRYFIIVAAPREGRREWCTRRAEEISAIKTERRTARKVCVFSAEK